MGNRTGRVDVLSFYGVIKNAFSFHTPEKAHSLLEKHLLRFGQKSSLILYVDGGPALEKLDTTNRRQETRTKAAEQCIKHLDSLEQTIRSDVKPRKSQFTDVKTSLRATFYWSYEDRRAFVHHMEDAGWMVRLCTTEADVAIAVDCKPGDIVISADSDMLAYGSVETLWRPINKYMVLEYDLADICQVLGFTRQHLTVLAIVSSNDYNRNIFSLGPATNYSIVKSLDTQGTLKKSHARLEGFFFFYNH